VSITASSGYAAAWGFHYYLTQYCHAHVSWAGRQVALPDTLPQVPGGSVMVTSNDRYAAATALQLPLKICELTPISI
jgi:alpha-N-acetylglucosaminidase